MQNVPQNSAKTSLPWLHFKTDHALRREENKVEFLEGRFLDEKLPFLHKKKAEHSFELSLSIFLSFNGVFLSLKCRTLVLKHLHGDRAAAILLKTKVSKYGKSEYSQALNASYTFQPLMSFWLQSTSSLKKKPALYYYWLFLVCIEKMLF